MTEALKGRNNDSKMLAFATASLTAVEIELVAVEKATLLAFAELSTFPASQHAQRHKAAIYISHVLGFSRCDWKRL